MIVYELGGNKFVYHRHFDSRDPDAIAKFHFEGWMRHYSIVAEILKMNNKVKGLVGCSWYYDPQLIKNKSKAYLFAGNRNEKWWQVIFHWS